MADYISPISMPIALIFPKHLAEFNILQQIGLYIKCLQNKTTEEEFNERYQSHSKRQQNRS